MEENKEPDVIIVTEYTCLIDYSLDLPLRNLFSQQEVDEYVNLGYTVVSYREWWDYKDAKFIRDQRRINRTVQQRIRRQITPKKPAPKGSKVKSKGTKVPKIQSPKPKSLAEILKGDSNIED